MFSTYCLSASWLLVVASLGIFQFIVEIALVFVLISHSTLSILSYTAFCDGAVVVCPSHPLPYAVSLIDQPVAIVSHALQLYTLRAQFVVSYQAVHAVGLAGAVADCFMSFTVTVPFTPFTVKTPSFAIVRVLVLPEVVYAFVSHVHVAILDAVSLIVTVQVPALVSLYTYTSSCWFASDP